MTTTIREATVDGPIASPKPMNPASTIYRDANPNVVAVPTGAFRYVRRLAPGRAYWRALGYDEDGN